MRRSFYRGVLAALLLSVASFAAEAQQATMPLPNGLYLGAEAGLIIPQSISIHGSGISGGSLIGAKGDLNLETGPAAGIIFVGHVNPAFAVEANLEYASMDLNSITGTFTTSGPPPAAFSGTIGLKGDFRTWNMLVNAIWTPFGAGSWNGFSPYIGAGVGVSLLHESLTSITALGTTVAGSANDNQTNFAANGILGFDFMVMPQLSVGARYRLLFINTASGSAGNGSPSQLFGQMGNFWGHVLTANATWHF